MDALEAAMSEHDEAALAEWLEWRVWLRKQKRRRP